MEITSFLAKILMKLNSIFLTDSVINSSLNVITVAAATVDQSMKKCFHTLGVFLFLFSAAVSVAIHVCRAERSGCRTMAIKNGNKTTNTNIFVIYHSWNVASVVWRRRCMAEKCIVKPPHASICTELQQIRAPFSACPTCESVLQNGGGKSV